MLGSCFTAQRWKCNLCIHPINSAVTDLPWGCICVSAAGGGMGELSPHREGGRKGGGEPQNYLGWKRSLRSNPTCD